MTRRLGASPAILGTLPAFTLTDQRGQPFGTRDLAGKVWVADFIFTSCQEACPLLSQKMAEVGRRARQLGPDFHLVSISVDPERDTPARLAEYAARYGANPLAWSFLTGPADAIEAAVDGGFKVGMGKEKVAAPGGNADDARLLADLPRREPGPGRPPAAHPRLLPGHARGDRPPDGRRRSGGERRLSRAGYGTRASQIRSRPS